VNDEHRGYIKRPERQPADGAREGLFTGLFDARYAPSSIARFGAGWTECSLFSRLPLGCERKYRRCSGKKPEGDEGVKDHASKRRRWHKGPDRVAPKVVHEIPARVRDPSEPDEPVRAKTAIHDRNHNRGIEQLPRTESAAQIYATGTGHDDRVQAPTRWLRHERHDQHENNGSDGRADVVDDEVGRAVRERPRGLILHNVAD
jgi:hypothetical protein